MSLSPSRGRDEQVNLINWRSLSSKNLSSQDSEYTVVRCCQMFAGVSTLVVLAFLLLKGSNELAKKFYEAPDRKAQNFLPPPPIERQGKKEAHGWVVVDDDSDDENEKKHYDNGYRWKWEGSTRYAAIQDAQPCYYEPVRDSKPGQDCFCQLAGNKACRSMPCQCPQGCSSDLTWRHHNTTTFKNFKYATGCQSQSSVALLTVPESHFENIRYLKTWCPKGAQSLLVEMFQKSLETFRDVVDKGPVRQCIHAAESVSVPWFHLHTICADGRIDGLPSSANIGWCSNMHSSSDAEPLAASVMVWAERLYGISGDTMPSSCSQMGCGIRGAAGRLGPRKKETDVMHGDAVVMPS